MQVQVQTQLQENGIFFISCICICIARVNQSIMTNDPLYNDVTYYSYLSLIAFIIISTKLQKDLEFEREIKFAKNAGSSNK